MKKLSKKISIFMVIMLLGALVLAGCTGSGETPNEDEEVAVDWPKKSIELVVPWSAGGGSDLFARTIVETIREEELLSEAITVINKPGASGIIGAGYTAGKPDDDHLIMTNVTGDVSAWYSSDTEDITVDKFKPVAMLAWDEYILMVDANSPYETFDDLIEDAKKNPGKVTIAGAGAGTVEHMINETMVAETGADIEYVPFDGGGEIMSAMLGGHITANWANPGEAAELIEAGSLKALVVARKERLDTFPDVPTTVELGYDIAFSQYRGIFASQNMPEEYIDILEDVLKKVSESDRFIEYTKANNLTLEYNAQEEFDAIVDNVAGLADEIFN